MTTARSLASLSLSILALAVAAAEVSGAGGALKRYNDGVPNGVMVTFSNSTPEDRFMQEYRAGTFSQGTVVCGGRVEHRNDGAPSAFTNFELRWEDPTHPGFCDISPAGLIAVADPGSFGLCGGGDAMSFPTFASGAGVLIDSAEHFYFTAILPIQTGPDCGILVDTNPPDFRRGKLYDSSRGAYEEAIGNLMLDVFAVEPMYFNFSVTMRGRQRFPGDPGIPMVFARRPNSTGPLTQTDDYVSATIVYDNFIAAPVSREITMEVDRSALRPGLGYRYVPLFRYVGTSIPFSGPIVLQPGRTRIAIEIPRALKDQVLPALPLNLRFRSRVWEPDFATGNPTSAFDVLGLRPYAGVLDDGTGETVTLPRVTGFLRDAMAVRFRAIDLPRTAAYTVSGVELLGREVGGTSLAGFDAIEVRRDDFLMTASPDMSPLGLLTSFGAVDGIGEVPAPGRTVVDLPDIAVDPTAGRSVDLWAIVYVRVGDRSVAGTLLGLDSTADTLLSDSFITFAGAVPFRAQAGNFVLRLLLDGQHSTLDDPRRGREPSAPDDARVQVLSTVEVVDYRRN